LRFWCRFMLHVELILGVLISEKSIISEESEISQIQWSYESIVVASLGHIVSVSENRCITRSNFYSGVGFPSRSKVISTKAEVELGEICISLHIRKQIQGFSRNSVLSEINMSTDITFSALTKLDGVLFLHRELNFTFVDDICGEFAIFISDINLNFVIEFATIGSWSLDLVSFKRSIDIVIWEHIVSSAKTSEGGEFKGLSHFFRKKPR